MLPNLADREKLLNLEGVEDAAIAADQGGDAPGPQVPVNDE